MFNLATSNRIDMRNADMGAVQELVNHREAVSSRVPLRGSFFGTDGKVGGELVMTAGGFQKVCTALGVPARFVQNFHDIDPEKTTDVLNRLVRHRAGEGLLFTVDENRIEGLVTQSYTRVPNSEVVDRVVRETEGGQINHFSMDGLKMRISMTYGQPLVIAGEDIIYAGADIYNSEDGGTALKGKGYISRKWCSNGCTVPVMSRQSRAIHRGDVLRYGRLGHIISSARNTALDAHGKIMDAFHTTLKTDRWGKVVKSAGSLFSEDELKEGTIKEWNERRTMLKLGPDGKTVYDVWNAVTSSARMEKDFTKAREKEEFAFSSILN